METIETPITNNLIQRDNLSISFLILHFVTLTSGIYSTFPNYLSGLFLDTYYYDGQDYWNPSKVISRETAEQILKMECTVNINMDA